MRTLLGVILSLIVLPGVAAEAEIKFLLNALYTAPLGADESPVLGLTLNRRWVVTVANVSAKPVTVAIFLCNPDTGDCQSFGAETLAPGASATRDHLSEGDDFLGGRSRYAKIVPFGPAGAIRAALYLAVYGETLIGSYTLEAH